MTGPYIFTLCAIRDAEPPSSSWATLLTALGYADDDYDPDRLISIGDVAVSNDLDDAWWCLRAVTDARARVFIVMPAVRRASVHTADQRIHDCIAAVERWLAGGDGADLETVAEAAREVYWAGLVSEVATKALASCAASAAAAAAEAAVQVSAAASADAAWASAAAAEGVAAWAAERTAEAEQAAVAAECTRQVADILRIAPPIILTSTARR